MQLFIFLILTIFSFLASSNNQETFQKPTNKNEYDFYNNKLYTDERKNLENYLIDRFPNNDTQNDSSQNDPYSINFEYVPFSKGTEFKLGTQTSVTTEKSILKKYTARLRDCFLGSHYRGYRNEVKGNPGKSFLRNIRIKLIYDKLQRDEKIASYIGLLSELIEKLKVSEYWFVSLGVLFIEGTIKIFDFQHPIKKTEGFDQDPYGILKGLNNLKMQLEKPLNDHSSNYIS